MTWRSVALDGRSAWIADDDPLAPPQRTWAVLRTRVIDELTGEPPRVAVKVRTDPDAPLSRHLLPRAVEGGLCGLAARVADVSPLLTRPGTFAAWIEAPGYLPRPLQPAIDAARHSLTVLAPPTALPLPLNIAPADPLPAPGDVRAQFPPGRGALLERDAPDQADEMPLVSDAAPGSATQVPLTAPLRALHSAGRHVAGVPLHLPDQPLHRATPVRLRGRIQQRVGPPAALVPAVGAQIGILGYWRRYPDTVAGAPLPLDFCAVTPALPDALDVGATVQDCVLAPAGAAIGLAASAPAGVRALLIQPFGALNPAGGDWLQIEATGRHETEWMHTVGFTPPADPLGAAQVRLRHPTAFVHRAGTLVQPLTLTPGAAAQPLTREAQTGDAVLFAANLAALPATGHLLLAGATPQAALVGFAQLPGAVALPPPAVNSFVISHAAVVDADGGFAWPAIARVAQIEIAVMHAGLSIAPRRFTLSYDGENPLSLIVP